MKSRKRRDLKASLHRLRRIHRRRSNIISRRGKTKFKSAKISNRIQLSKSKRVAAKEGSKSFPNLLLRSRVNSRSIELGKISRCRGRRDLKIKTRKCSTSRRKRIKREERHPVKVSLLNTSPNICPKS